MSDPVKIIEKQNEIIDDLQNQITALLLEREDLLIQLQAALAKVHVMAYSMAKVSCQLMGAHIFTRAILDKCGFVDDPSEMVTIYEKGRASSGG